LSNNHTITIISCGSHSHPYLLLPLLPHAAPTAFSLATSNDGRAGVLLAAVVPPRPPPRRNANAHDIRGRDYVAALLRLACGEHDVGAGRRRARSAELDLAPCRRPRHAVPVQICSAELGLAPRRRPRHAAVPAQFCAAELGLALRRRLQHIVLAQLCADEVFQHLESSPATADNPPAPASHHTNGLAGDNFFSLLSLLRGYAIERLSAPVVGVLMRPTTSCKL
jgi:hypothetical protein